MTKILSRIAVALLLFFTVSLSHAQQWFDVAAKGSIGANILYNKNFFATNNITTLMGLGNSYGVSLGYNLSPQHKVSLEGLSSTFKQEFAYDLRFDHPNSELQLNNYDFLLLYRKSSDVSYLEVGPQYSLIHKTDVTYAPVTGKVQELESKNYLRSSYISMVVGFGGYYSLADNLTLEVGGRFKFGLNDVISDEGRSTGFPYGPLKETEDAPSIPIVAEFVVGLNFDLGYIANRSCGRGHRKFKMFGR